MSLSTYIPICDALVQLMAPLIEVVIHHIDSDSIIYISGDLSGRKKGDPSLLDKAALSEMQQVVYPKVNFDGKLVKSISVPVEGEWVLCINCDVSVFNKMYELSKALLESSMEAQPKALFANDWQEKLHRSIHEYVQNHQLSFEHLTQKHKKMLVTHLFELGAFNEKNAADYVAKVLRLGRATVFNYLKELRS